MKAFSKPMLLAGLGITCLALGSGAQPPAPPPVPSVAPAAQRVVNVFGHAHEDGIQVAPTAVVPGQGTYTLRTSANNDHMLWVARADASDGEARKIAKQISDAKTDSDKDKLREKMKDVLGKSFEDRQKRHEKEIEALETQLKKLKEMVEKRKENKKEIIDDRIKQLMREAQGLGW